MANHTITAADTLARHLRRLKAERLGWPAGVLETCEQTEPLHPGWRITWDVKHELFDAVHTVRHLSYRWVRSQSIEDLVEKMVQADLRAFEYRTECELLAPHGWRG
ncbi:hypothetical protein ACQP2E_16360 [Actinoplanes sp. CA-015351]|uniref:hypothetical protein n=1 Tax=Actinoplanes sp. CA-015351 TaxID=3239897 RepID=UPI003D98721D